MTRRIVPLPRNPHREVQALLPWYAAGTLDANDRDLVRDHLSRCVACREELADERGLVMALTAVPGVAPPSVDDGWNALDRELDRQADAPVRPRRGFPAWSSAAPWAHRSRPAWTGWTIAAQFAAIVVLGGMLASSNHSERYHALGAETAARGANVVVVFKPDTTETDLRSILRSAGARLVDGPTAAGGYMLHVLADRRPETLRMLRRDRSVLLAEPVDAG